MRSWNRAAVGVVVAAAMTVATGVAAFADGSDDASVQQSESVSQQAAQGASSSEAAPAAPGETTPSDDASQGQTPEPGSGSSLAAQGSSSQGGNDQSKQSKQSQQTPGPQSGDQTGQQPQAQGSGDCDKSGIWKNGTAPYRYEQVGDGCVVHVGAGTIAGDQYRANANEKATAPWIDRGAMAVSDVSSVKIVGISFEGPVTIYAQPDSQGVHKSMERLFTGLPYLKTVTGLNNIDTTGVVSLGYLFQYDKSLESVDVSGWDTSQVKSMSMVFAGNKSLTEIKGLANWDVSQVQYMVSMFAGTQEITNLDGVQGWHPDSLKWSNRMFENMPLLANLDLSAWAGHTPNLEDITEMFDNDLSTPSQLHLTGLGGWSTPKLTNMRFAFFGCYQLTSLDLSGWDMTHITDPNNDVDAFPYSLQSITLGPKARLYYSYSGGYVYSAFYGSPINGGALPQYNFTGKWAESLDDAIPYSGSYDSATLGDLTQTHGFRGGTFVWERSAKLTFDKNAEDATGEVNDITKTAAEFSAAHPGDVVVPNASYSRTGFEFAGWKIDGSDTVYHAADHVSLTAPGTVTLHAQWTKKSTGQTSLQGYHAKYEVLYHATTAGVGTHHTVTIKHGYQGACAGQPNMPPQCDVFTVDGNSANDVMHQNRTVLDGMGVYELQIKRTPYLFKTWNTKPDGTGTTYRAGDTIALHPGVTNLYTQWEPGAKYKVTYDSNKPQDATTVTGSMGPVRMTIRGVDHPHVNYFNYKYTLLDNVYAIDPGTPANMGSWKFIGWSTERHGISSTTYAPGQRIGLKPGSTKLYAQWVRLPGHMDGVVAATYMVRYLPNTPDDATSSGVMADDIFHVNKHDDPTADFNDQSRTVLDNEYTVDGYRFTGWTTEARGGTHYAPGDRIEHMSPGMVTLYAHWQKVSTPRRQGGQTPLPGGGNNPLIRVVPTPVIVPAANTAANGNGQGSDDMVKGKHGARPKCMPSSVENRLRNKARSHAKTADWIVTDESQVDANAAAWSDAEYEGLPRCAAVAPSNVTSGANTQMNWWWLLFLIALTALVLWFVFFKRRRQDIWPVRHFSGERNRAA
ncbi:BspA family leucine-rich repeat surface protein [Bifidobacterium sp. ESL0790]|uniref:BspA family leucine-rich repeat surface protein n=1 Tax=Bifidobacterium sp. ESL0790 TaxID=2983233 RepID=UPI0023F9015E|nr:BspA family leucine-rich repeat surface protein [Bifidobacterium sp. ESL0790]WEV72237.1 BspA family leucine-rich repeat surface protein [Bifidobacterium sp. ESL0790]